VSQTIFAADYRYAWREVSKPDGSPKVRSRLADDALL